MAFHGSDLYNTIGLALGDVAGWNLYQGWYFGELPHFEQWLEDQHARYPHRPIIVSEWGAGSDKRIHSVKGRPFDFSMEYQQEYIEHYLPYIEIMTTLPDVLIGGTSISTWPPARNLCLVSTIRGFSIMTGLRKI